MIYLRGCKDKDKANCLYFKFHNADGMFSHLFPETGDLLACMGLADNGGRHVQSPVCLSERVGRSRFVRYFPVGLEWLLTCQINSHAVRALRIKRNNVESYQKAGVQFWHEQSINKINPKGVATVPLNTASTVRSNATVKVHSTRIAMYIYHEKKVVLLFGMPIAHNQVSLPRRD